MRLINIEPFEKENNLEDCSIRQYMSGDGYCSVKTISTREVPSVDAVPVVRCRDCKHYTAETGWCKIHSRFDGGILPDWNRFTAEDYCSHGERKGDV